MTQPLVSIVVPVYNGEKYLDAALKSIFAQDYQPIDVIVIDDGSVDGSAKIAKSFKKARYTYQNHQGAAVARNLGISQAKGELIAFLDQDDMWTQNKTRVQVRYLLEHPDVQYVIAKQWIFLEPGVIPPSCQRTEKLETEQLGYLPGTLMVRKSCFEKIGIFNPKFTNVSDTEWFFRAKDLQVSMEIIPEVLLRRRIHESNQSSILTKDIHGEFLKVAMESIKKQRDKSERVES